MPRFSVSLSVLLAISATLPAVAQPVAPSSTASVSTPGAIGVFAGDDPAVRPQDDLFEFANGGWLARTRIPADKQSYGTFQILEERSDKDVRALIEAAAAKKHPDADDKLIGDFYASFIDVKGIEHRGLAPLKPAFARIAAMRTQDDLAVELARLGREGVDVPMSMGVGPDERNPERYAVYWGQGGLGLPDRDYYLKTDKASRAIQRAYLGYLTQVNRLAKVADPVDAAKRTYDFEAQIAKISWPRTKLRQALATYNFEPRSSWTTKLGDFPWDVWARASGMPAGLGAIVGEPDYAFNFSELAKQTPLTTWKAYLRSRWLDTFGQGLPEAFRDARFAFKGKVLAGLEAQPPRWRIAVNLANDEIGEAIGKKYVALHFPPADKAKVLGLVHNLLGVYKTSLEHLDWMTPATRKAALAKLALFGVKIGYPDKWRGYAGLVVRRDDPVGNLVRANVFSFDRDMKDAGKPVDHTRWDMTPQTVNAYNNPVGNEIVFPAAILQPPFFDSKADMAYNYGAIGAVIGHEISHGFDDQGRHYNGHGRLADWWTKADDQAFEARAKRLVAQYDAFEALPGMHVNGKLTLGENIADLTGIEMAFRAYQRSLHGKPAPVVDGWTGDQRFFLGWARNWRGKNRPQWQRELLSIDPHSPDRARADLIVEDTDAFYKAFDVKPGDKMYLPPADRVHIW